MIDLKKVISGASLYTLLGLMPALSRIILLPVYLEYLPPAEFALISLFTLLTSIFPVFMTFSLEHALIRHYFDYRKNSRMVKAYVSTILLFVLGISILCAVIFYPFGTWAFDLMFKTDRFGFAEFGIYVLLQSISFSLIAVLNAFFRTAEWLKTFAAFSVGLLAISTAAEAYAILGLKGNALVVVQYKSIATAAVTLLFVIIQLIYTGIRFDKRFLPSSLNYAAPVVPYVLFGIIFASFDRIVIENYRGLDPLAVFNLAAAIGSLCDIYITALQNATYPMIYDLFKKGYRSHANAINAIYKFKGSMILFGGGVLSFIAYPLIHGFLRVEYQAAIPLIPIIMAGFVPRFYYIAYSEPVFFFRQTRRLPALNFILGVVSVSFNLVLVPVLGLAGAAIAILCARWSQLIPTLTLYKKVSDFRFSLGSYHSYAILFFLASTLSGALMLILDPSSLMIYLLLSIPMIIGILSVILLNRTKANA